jgi:alanine racemase
MRETVAEINLSNLKFNFLNIRKRVKQTKVMAVIKADAYGHGMIQCAKALETLGDKSPDYYGFALLEEAIELRSSKIKKPVLIFAPVQLSEINNYLKYNIEPTVASEKQIKELIGYSGRKLKLQVNVDTGMGRIGISYDSAIELITKLTANKKIEITGIYTHFATSDDENKKYANLQLERFKYIVETLKQKNICTGLAHAANSGAILDMSDSYFDMVRPGIALYGYYPSLETSESIKLKPVMSLVSKVSTIKEIRKGESVSYGRLFIAKDNTRVATVPLGYADGLNRNLTNKIYGIIKGKLYSQVGRVTMDRISFEIKNDKVREGDKIILLGKSGNNEIDAWHWSSLLNTIPYEITCNISKRVPRTYKA